MLGKELIKQILDKNLTNSEIDIFDADQDMHRDIVTLEMDTSDEDETVGSLVVE